MALTLTRVGRPRKNGNKKEIDWDITWDSSYASGGEEVTARELGMRRVDDVNAKFLSGSESATLRPTNCYYSGGKFHLIDSATGKEMEATKDMSKVKTRVTVIGV